MASHAVLPVVVSLCSLVGATGWLGPPELEPELEPWTRSNHFFKGQRVRSLIPAPQWQPRPLNVGDQGVILGLASNQDGVLSVLFDGHPPMKGQVSLHDVHPLFFIGQRVSSLLRGAYEDGGKLEVGDEGTLLGPVLEGSFDAHVVFDGDPPLYAEIPLDSLHPLFLIGDRVRSLIHEGGWHPRPLSVGDEGVIIGAPHTDKHEVQVRFDGEQGLLEGDLRFSELQVVRASNAAEAEQRIVEPSAAPWPVAVAVIGGFAIAVVLCPQLRRRFSAPVEGGVKMPELQEKTAASGMTRSSRNGRKTGRYGLGADAPTQGTRLIFPAGYAPKLDVEAAVRACHAFTDEELAAMSQRAQLTTARMLGRGMNVTKGNSTSLDAYTQESPLYKDMNKALRHATPETDRILDQYREYIYHLMQAISNLPSCQGRTYRAIKVRVKPTEYTVGTTITWQAPSSASKSMLVPADFVGWDGNDMTGTFFVVESNSGKDISSFSAFPEEEEVLFQPNSFFRVVRHAERLEEKAQLLEQLDHYGMERLTVIVLEQV